MDSMLDPDSDHNPDDPEEFCSVCFAGMGSSEHHEKCEQEPDPFSPPLRELADGLAQYLDSYMQEVAECGTDPRSVDYQLLAEDFVDSCVVGIMQIDGDVR